MKNMAIPALGLLLSINTFANLEDNQKMMDEAFDRVAKHASLNCEYKYWLNTAPVETLEQNFDSPILSAKYKINEDIVDIRVTPPEKLEESSAVTNYIFNNNSESRVDYKINGVSFDIKLDRKNMMEFKNPEELSQEQKSLYDRLNLGDLTCSLEFGEEDNIRIEEKVIHINMHPHRNYDVDGESLPGMQREINTDRKTYVVLDDFYNNKNFGRFTSFSTFLTNGGVQVNKEKRLNFAGPIDLELPSDIPMIVAQAGHNRYLLTQENHEIIFTGGNHNFCILNNTRRLMHAFMENPNSKTITFKYIKDATVVQRKTWLNDGNIPRSVFRKSNMLSGVFAAMSDKEKSKYLNGYVDYFANSYLNEKKYYFSKAVLKSRGVNGQDITKTINGMGSGEIEINFIYE